MNHEVGLTRVVEIVMGKCGHIFEIYRIMSQQACLLTVMEVYMREREENDASDSGCIY